MKTHRMSHLVKSEDLNHHGTLFAGRMAEWFVEGTFIAAASAVGNPDNVVCIKLHGLKFGKPTKKGEIISLETKVVYCGNTSLTVHGKVTLEGHEDILVEGFTTFVCVDLDGKKRTHGLTTPEPTNETEANILEIARHLK